MQKQKKGILLGAALLSVIFLGAFIAGFAKNNSRQVIEEQEIYNKIAENYGATQASENEALEYKEASNEAAETAEGDAEDTENVSFWTGIEESEQIEPEEVLPELTGAEELDEGIVSEAPRSMETPEAKQIFEERAKEDPRYETVLANWNELPRRIILDLANIPEMIPFVVDFPNGTPEDTSLRQVEIEQDCPLFLQWDKRWGYNAYGANSTIAVSGCGPTSLAMVVVGLTKQEVTPAEMADYAMEKNFYMAGHGTTWSLMSTGAAEFGLYSKMISYTEKGLKEALDAGKLIIVSMREGDFTLNGHFLVIRGYDEEGFIINDPMSIYRSKLRWPYAVIKSQIKGAWALCEASKAKEEAARAEASKEEAVSENAEAEETVVQPEETMELTEEDGL